MKRVVSLVVAFCICMMSVPILPVEANGLFDESAYVLTGDQLEDIIGIAKTQVGYCEGNNSTQLDGTVAGSGNYTKYAKDLGKTQGAWCAYFVSWCAKKANCLNTAIVYSAGAPSKYVATSKPYKTNGLGTYHAVKSYKLTNTDYFKPAYTPVVENYKPKKGDLAIYTGHVGIVIADYNSSTGTFEMIDGNNGGKVTRRYVSLASSSKLIGFYTPEYVTTTPVHTHSYSTTTESAHPHYVYQNCSCGSIVSKGKATSATCKECYPLGNITLKRSFEKTNGTATFYRNTITNANKYTLKLYKDGTLYKEYDMMNTERSISGLPSGTYNTTLYVYNVNTGESKSVSCESFKIVDTYEVTYNANGGINVPSNQTKIQDTDLTLSTVKPSREGYVFKGWAASKNAVEAQYMAGGSYAKNAKITLYAVWEPETYTIKFDANGGTGEIGSITIKYGDTIKMPNGVICEYAYLKGWSTDKNATIPTYLFGEDYTIKSDVTLYAVWGQSTWSGSVSSSLKGTGTEEDPYLISSEGDLAYLANKVNGQTSKPKYEYYKLTQNINLNYAEWTPIGIYDNSYQYFYGSFDGNGYTISDFYISSIGTCHIGLFGYIKDSEIKNLNMTGAIEGFTLSKQLFIGGVVGRADNTEIENCNVMNFSVSGISTYQYVDTFVGCIAGYASLGRISDCSVKNSYIGLKTGSYVTGMVAGFSSASIEGCTVLSNSGLFGTTTLVSGYSMGGLCGYLEATAKRCTVNAPYLSNSLKTTQQSEIGGLIGWCSGSVEICAVNFTDESKTYTIDGGSYFSSILVEGTGFGEVGGITGNMESTAKITDCKYNGKSIFNTSTSTFYGAYTGSMVGNINAKSDVKVRVNGGQTLNMFDLPVKRGYEAKWYRDSDFTQEYDFTQIVGSDMTLYAKWEATDGVNVWDGTTKEPRYNADTLTYTITCGEELAWVAEVTRGLITTGNNIPDDITFKGYTIELLENIYLNDISDYDNWETSPPENQWRGIGVKTNPFSGTFEGNNYSISGAYINKTNALNIGLIGCLSYGTVKNLYVSNMYVCGGINVGSMIGCTNNSILSHCYSYGIVSGEENVGGIVGEIKYSTILECYNYTKISGDDRVGGICGYGINTEISECGNFEEIFGSEYIAGICGFSTGSIENSYNEGKITANSYYAGGICGYSDDKIQQCYNYGSLNECEDAVYVGGIVGMYVGSEIAYCYNQSPVSGKNHVGGIAGNITRESSGGTQAVKYSYNRGSVYIGTGSLYGGIVGCWNGNNSALYLSYCHTNSSPLYNANMPIFVYSSTSSIIPKSDMKILSNLSGFSDSMWAVDSSINNGYPYLIDMQETHKEYVITAVAERDKTAINRSFAKVDGIVHSESFENSYAGGAVGRGYANYGSNAEVKNVIIMADKISSISSNSSSYARSGYMIGFNTNNAFDFSSNSYYVSEMDVAAVNNATSTNIAINVDGTERSTNTLNTSFYTTKMGLNPYISLANLENDETAVWVLKNGEIPELYYNVLNDITISKDIVNGTVAVDRTQAVDGEIVEVTVFPDAGYVLSAIYVNGEEIVGLTFPVDGDCNVYATFNEEMATYNVKVEAHDNATGTVTNVDNSDAMMLFGETDSLTVNDGEEVLVNTNANTDYTVDTIYVNGEEVAGNNFIVTENSVVTMEVVSISTEIEAITNDASEIGVYFATLSGEVKSENGTVKYIRYWETANPQVIYTTEVQSGTGNYTVMVDDLNAETEYSFQMADSGEIKSFTTLAENELSEEYEAEEVAVSGVAVNTTTVNLEIGDSETLTAEVEPMDATNKAVEWKSSDESVATVENGIVTAKSAGSVTITVTTEDGGFSAECTVTVKASAVPVEGISIDKPSVALSVGGIEQLTATVTPSNATDKTVTWSCNNESVAMISSAGVVVGVGVGTAVVVVKANDGNHTAFCVVTVSEPITEEPTEQPDTEEPGDPGASAPEEPEITLSGTDTVKITLTGELTGKVVAALYNEGNVMVEMKIFDAAENINVDFTKNGSYVKVMWVKSLTSLEPKCEAKTKNLK